jgi:hypothetical protein
MKLDITATSVAANTTGLLSNATGATWTLTANDSGDGLAHLITVKGDAATDHSLKTAVITGTDANGAAQSETINLPNGTATVTTTAYFKTVATVVPSATIGADTMDIGWAAGSVSPSVYPDVRRAGIFSIGFGCRVASGSPNYTVQHSYDGSAWYDHATVAGETSSQDGSYSAPVAGIRLKFTVAGGVVLTGFQIGV